MQCTRKPRHVSTRRSVDELDKLAKQIAPMSYDIRDYAKLGLLYKLLHVEKSRGNRHSRKFAAYRPNWSGRSQMPALALSTFAIDSNPKKRAKCERASILVRTKLEAQWLEN